MRKFTKEVYEKMIQEFPSFKELDVLCREFVDMPLIDLIRFHMAYGDFATGALMSSRFKAKQQQAKDPMREAVKELVDDKEFMANITPAIAKMAHDAIYHQKYNA